MFISFIQLNEINFEVANKYIKKGYKLDFIKKIIDNSIDTYEEEEYKNLEPWIQWVSIFKGKLFKDHNIFRLGDGAKIPGDNLFSDINQKLKMTCGAISPMNITSKNLNLDFFIPDPWSSEKVKGGIFLQLIYDAVKQGVNDNTGNGLSYLNKIKLFLGIAFVLDLKSIKIIFEFYRSIKNKSYRKALLLDLILVLLHQKLIKKHHTNFSSVFLNGGAYIQHHYFFNSLVLSKKFSKNPSWYISPDFDPIAEALVFYDKIIGSYERLGHKIILMNGLQQVPYGELKYYYRLKKHKEFCKFIGIKFKDIFPRMTRDFEIIFEDEYSQENAYEILDSIKDYNKIKVFNEIEIRNLSLFCTLTYPFEVKEKKIFFYKDKSFELFEFVNFVAIKNGKHDMNGKLYISDLNLRKKYGNKISLDIVRNLLINELKSI